MMQVSDVCLLLETGGGFFEGCAGGPINGLILKTHPHRFANHNFCYRKPQHGERD